MNATTLNAGSGHPFPGASPEDRMARRIAVASAVAFHLAILAALLSYAPARNASATKAPIVVDLIVAAAEPPPPPRKPVVKPRAAPAERQVAPLPIVVAPVESPTAFVAPPQPEQRTLPPANTVVVSEPAPPAPVTPPRFSADYLQNPSPPYPALARRMKEQGKVILRVLVSADGLAERVELRTSSGSTRLDQSAQETVKTWKFVPARQGDQKVAAWVLVPIAFTLDS